MPKIQEKAIIAALSRVKDPELGRDLVSLNMIKDIKIEGARVSFAVVLTTPACPLRDQIQREAKAAVLAVPGVQEVEVTVTANVRAGVRPQADLLPQVKNVIAVSSNKGGVGKSTVSVNLALALSQTGARVGLLDADVTGPNIPMMTGAKGVLSPNADGHIQPDSAHGISVMSLGFFMDDDQAVIWRGPMIHGAIQQMLGDVSWGELDYLVVDLPPGTSDAPLTLSQSVPLTGVVVVITPQDVALQDARKAIAMFNKMEVPVLGLVENMSYFICPHCGEETDIFGRGGAEKVCEALDIELLGQIPLEPAIRQGGDTGTPVMTGAPDSFVAEAFRRIAGRVAGKVSVINAERPSERKEKSPARP